MPTIDQFESTFRHAAKDVYRYSEIRYNNVLVVTDLDEAGAEAFSSHAHKLLEANGQTAGKGWKNLTRDTFKNVQELLEVVKREAPDLICTYRNLHSVAWQWPYSLGEYLDVLSQAAQPPVLVLPHPSSGRAAKHALENTDVVMAMTDHLSGDNLLVNHALGFVEKAGRLVLAHVEDGATFERYIETISKIASIDTENAREKIQAQLLEEPLGFIESCRAGIEEAGLDVQILPEVRMGHHIAEYRRLVEEHKVDLLVINTKDEDQLAMHGLAYPVAVELREIPLLML